MSKNLSITSPYHLDLASPNKVNRGTLVHKTSNNKKSNN